MASYKQNYCYVLYFPFFLLAAIVVTALFWKYAIPILLACVLIECASYCCARPEPVRALSPIQTNPEKSNDNTELMFFMHGWPDDARIWDKFAKIYRDSHICVRYDMPGYNGPSWCFTWNYNLEDLVECIAETLKAALAEHNKKSCILCAHDWGAILGEMLQRKHPELVHKMVLFDVQLNPARISLGTYVFFGFIYQFWLVLAFLISSIPCVGAIVGNAMTRSMASGMGAPLSQSPEDRKRISAAMNYVYFYLMKKIMWHKFCSCLPNQADTSNNMGAPLTGRGQVQIPDVPTLLVYAMHAFHHKDFEQGLRDKQDCDAIQLPDDCDHWCLYSNADIVNPIVKDWLNTGKKKDSNRDIPVTGYTG